MKIKNKSVISDKYLELIDKIYKEDKSLSLDDTINTFKKVEDHFDKYSIEELLYLKSELNGILEDLKQVAIITGFMSLVFSIILLFINSSVEFMSSNFPEKNIMLLNWIKYIIILVVCLTILISFGKILMRYSVRYRRLNIVNNILNNYIEKYKKEKE
ncbi:hypothetical protein AB4Z30_29700 [Paenibacillus sp. 2TAF8]|uniref:hypothetical protein n=1 Tax=Paenibacillus sp. 2TAF8 TaxID=3233020 RepID=UPI003F970F74